MVIIIGVKNLLIIKVSDPLIFSGRLSYNKGAMVLHMLRQKLGDIEFYQGLQDYLVTPGLAYDYAKTQDYVRTARSKGVPEGKIYTKHIFRNN